jgi:hypothetical protein
MFEKVSDEELNAEGNEDGNGDPCIIAMREETDEA